MGLNPAVVSLAGSTTKLVERLTIAGKSQVPCWMKGTLANNRRSAPRGSSSRRLSTLNTMVVRRGSVYGSQRARSGWFGSPLRANASSARLHDCRYAARLCAIAGHRFARGRACRTSAVCRACGMRPTCRRLAGSPNRAGTRTPVSPVRHAVPPRRWRRATSVPAVVAEKNTSDGEYCGYHRRYSATTSAPEMSTRNSASRRCGKASQVRFQELGSPRPISARVSSWVLPIIIGMPADCSGASG